VFCLKKFGNALCLLLISVDSVDFLAGIKVLLRSSIGYHCTDNIGFGLFLEKQGLSSGPCIQQLSYQVIF